MKYLHYTFVAKCVAITNILTILLRCCLWLIVFSCVCNIQLLIVC